MPEILTIKKVSEQTGYNPNTIRRWIDQGKIKAEKIGNQIWVVDDESLEKYLAEIVGSQDRRFGPKG